MRSCDRESLCDGESSDTTERAYAIERRQRELRDEMINKQRPTEKIKDEK